MNQATIILVLGAICAAGFSGFAADDALATKAASGDYQASPVLAGDARYSVGVFTVERSAGKRQIVPSAGYAGIFYPDANECDHFDVPLAATRIPISDTGRFRIVERTPVEDTSVQVDWRGRWSEGGVLAGSVTIRFGGCTSTHRWTGGKVA